MKRVWLPGKGFVRVEDDHDDYGFDDTWTKSVKAGEWRNLYAWSHSHRLYLTALIKLRGYMAWVTDKTPNNRDRLFLKTQGLVDFDRKINSLPKSPVDAYSTPLYPME